MPNQTRKSEPQQNPRKVVDLGLSYGREYFRELLPFLAPVILVQLFSVYALSAESLSRGSLFLAEVLYCLASSWLISCLAIFLVCRFRGEVLSRLAIAKEAFKITPKVTFPYLFLVFLIAGAGFDLFMWAIVSQVLWAPFFCALEACAVPGKSSPSPEPEFEPTDTSGPFILDEQGVVRFPTFRDQGLFDVGLLRSFHFAGNNIWKTLLLMVFAWAANVIPYGLASLIESPGSGIFYSGVALVIVSLLELVVIVGGMVLLLASVSKEAREELGLSEIPYLSRGSLASGKLKFLSIVLMASLATSILVSRIKEQRTLPESSVAWARYAEVVDGKLQLEVYLEDSEKKFSWFERGEFLLGLEGRDSEIAAKRVTVFDENKNRLFKLKGQNSAFLKLSFQVPESSSEAKYRLFFKSEMGQSGAIVEGRFPHGSSGLS